MEIQTDTKKLLEDKIIELATKYGNTTYIDKQESYIAAKGYATGYQRALLETNVKIKELASIIKLLLPGIRAIPPDNLGVIEKFIKESDNENELS